MRRWKLIVALAGLAAVAAGTFALWPRPERITRDNFERIRNGMTRADVEAILGPAGDYTSGPIEDPERYGFLMSNRRPYELPISYREADGNDMTQWRADEGLIWVVFAPSGNVLHSSYWDVKKSEQALFDNLLWRAKLQCRRWFPE